MSSFLNVMMTHSETRIIFEVEVSANQYDHLCHHACGVLIARSETQRMTENRWRERDKVTLAAAEGVKEGGMEEGREGN